MIPYGRQDISDEDVQSVIDVLRSDFLTQGPAVEKFEQEMARLCGTKFAVAVSNATSALHLACLAVGLGKDDVFWTSPNTFVASANCGLYCEATPDFVDIDLRTYNLDTAALEEKLVRAEQQGKIPKLVIPVHFAGQSCDMQRIAELSTRFGFSIIEDASHAVGGSYLGVPVGACRFSDMTVFSFHPVKIVTSGEGGMILTNRPDLYEKLVCLRSHGITRDPQRMDREPDGPWYYQQSELGFNYRMTDIQAALGRSQLQRLDQFVERRRILAGRYDVALSSLPLILPWCAPEALSAWHLYVVRVQLHKCTKSHLEVFQALRAQGIGVNLHYIPVHTQPYYRRFGFVPGDFPAAEQYYREAISLPMFYGMSDEMHDQVVDTLFRVLS